MYRNLAIFLRLFWVLAIENLKNDLIVACLIFEFCFSRKTLPNRKEAEHKIPPHT
jgi:hypothetical protein